MHTYLPLILMRHGNGRGPDFDGGRYQPKITYVRKGVSIFDLDERGQLIDMPSVIVSESAQHQLLAVEFSLPKLNFERYEYCTVHNCGRST